MKQFLLVIVVCGALPHCSALAGSGGGVPQVPDGIVVPQPAGDENCVAVRLEVPGDQMLTGVRWYNGSGAVSFGRILVASGSGLYPPNMAQALVVAEDVTGTESAWSAAEFAQPVASQTGTLFAVFQYHAGYSPAEGVSAHGIGYRMQDTPEHYFISGDGQQWFKIANGWRLMIEPILAARDPSVVALSETAVEEDRVPLPLPRALAINAYPNPFNPAIKLELQLPLAGPVEVKVYDVRGRQVRRLHAANEAAGTLTMIWDGRDNGGRRLGSGVYWARVETAAGRLTSRMVLVK
jgi:hypothetical protein